MAKYCYNAFDLDIADGFIAYCDTKPYIGKQFSIADCSFEIINVDDDSFFYRKLDDSVS